MSVSPVFFTVVIPHFNANAKELTRALHSVVSQAGSGLQIQIVCIDDGSETNSARIAAELFKSYQSRPHIDLEAITHTHNQGLAAARNTGIDAAKGQYLLFLDSDDWFLPGVLEKLTAYLKSHEPELALLQTALVSTSETKQKYGVCVADTAIALASPSAPEMVSPATLPELSLALSSWAQVYSVDFLRRTSLKFDPVLRRWEDRPFLVASQLQAKGILLVPLLARAYFVPAKSKKSASITRSGLHPMDALYMARHIKGVQKLLRRYWSRSISAYEAQHFWQSVARFYSIVGGSAWLRLTHDKKMRKLVAASSLGLWQWRNELGVQLSPPLGILPFARFPAGVRNYLLWSLGQARNPAGLTNLALLFALVALVRRIRQGIR